MSTENNADRGTVLFLEHLPMILIIVVYIGCGYAMQWLMGLDGMMRLSFLSREISLAAGAFSLGWLGVFVLLRGARSGRDTGGLIQGTKRVLRHHVVHPRILGGFLLVFVFYVPFITSFVSYKRVIPRLNPFGWDRLFMRIDGWIHGGVQPWRWIHPWAGFPLAVKLLDALYYVWFFVVIGVLVWQAWSRYRFLRARFLVSFVLTWIVLGTLMATLFSSAGPCYYQEVVGSPNPYRPLMQHLESVDESHPLTALRVQDLLWHGRTQQGLPRHGIAAMPSLHIAVPMLFVLLGFRRERWLGWVFAFYTAVVLVGSVYLGWHYAIDGYVSIILVPLIWVATDRALRVYCRVLDLDLGPMRRMNVETGLAHPPESERSEALSGGTSGN